MTLIKQIVDGEQLPDQCLFAFCGKYQMCAINEAI